MGGVDLKLVLLGCKNVGKTSLFNRYVYDEYGPTSMTIGAYFAVKKCRVRDKDYSLAIWDTAGEEKFDSLTNFYCRGAQAAVVCYDVTNAASFHSLDRWLSKLAAEADDNCVVLICGNKMDLVEEDPGRRKVTEAEANALAATKNAEAIEVSARSGDNVSDIFSRIVQLCIERNLTLSRDDPLADANVALDAAAEPTRNTCC